MKLKLDNGTIYNRDGKLEFVESNVSQTTGTFTLRAEFPNPDRLLLPGMYVRAIIQEGVAENSFLVPQRGVTRNTKGEATAMFVNADGKVEQRVLTVAPQRRQQLAGQHRHQGRRPRHRRGHATGAPGQAVNGVEVTIDETTGEVRPQPRAHASCGRQPGPGTRHRSREELSNVAISSSTARSLPGSSPSSSCSAACSPCKLAADRAISADRADHRQHQRDLSRRRRRRRSRIR